MNSIYIIAYTVYCIKWPKGMSSYLPQQSIHVVYSSSRDGLFIVIPAHNYLNIPLLSDNPYSPGISYDVPLPICSMNGIFTVPTLFFLDFCWYIFYTGSMWVIINGLPHASTVKSIISHHLSWPIVPCHDSRSSMLGEILPRGPTCCSVSCRRNVMWQRKEHGVAPCFIGKCPKSTILDLHIDIYIYMCVCVCLCLWCKYIYI